MQLGSLIWDDTGKRNYYTGIDGVALYVWNDDIKWYGYEDGYEYSLSDYVDAWNGVTAINESPSGAESNKLYADNIEYLNLLSKEEFGLTLECYQVPEAFDQCDGIASLAVGLKFRGKTRKPFALVYRVQKGSDTTAAGELGYVYHVVYGCKASPSSRDFATVNDSPEAQTFSYEISATAPTYPLVANMSDGEFREEFGNTFVSINNSLTAYTHIEIDSTRLTADQHALLKARLYGVFAGGTDSESPISDEKVDAYLLTYFNGSAYSGSYSFATIYDLDNFHVLPTPDELVAICNYVEPTQG